MPLPTPPRQATRTVQLGADTLAVSLSDDSAWYAQEKLTVGCPLRLEIDRVALRFRSWKALEEAMLPEGVLSGLDLRIASAVNEVWRELKER